jgi:hypothetical protein
MVEHFFSCLRKIKKEKQMKQKDINIGDKFGIYEVLGELQRTKTI